MGLITDGRFSGGTCGMVVGHVAPEAAVGGADRARAGGRSRSRSMPTRACCNSIFPRRSSSGGVPLAAAAVRATREGVLAKYAKLVSSASTGAVTD